MIRRNGEEEPSCLREDDPMDASAAAITAKDTIALGLGAVGTVLGIYNAWTARAQRQVRVRVEPRFASGPQIGKAFAIEVVNLSSFAVTLEHTGFTLKGTKTRAVAVPLTVDGKPWPRRLEAREAVSVYCHPFKSMAADPPIKAAYAQLASGEIITGKGPALAKLQEILNARGNP